MAHLGLAVEMLWLDLAAGMLQLDVAVGIPLIELYEFQLLADKPFDCVLFAYKYDMFYVNHIFSIVFHLF